MPCFNNATHVDPFLKICGEHSVVLPSENYWSLTGEEERLRAIAQWQQKAFVFEHGAALRQAEDQFRLLVEAVQDYAIFMLDPGGQVSTWKALRVLC